MSTALIVATYSSAGQQFSVHGTVVTERINALGNITQRITNDFNMRVSENLWELTLTPYDKDHWDYQTISYDGTNLYLFLNCETINSKFIAKDKAAGSSQPPENQNLAEGSVVEQNAPCFAGYEEAGTLWLTYASGNYLSQIKTNALPAVWPYGLRHMPIIPGMPAIVRRADWKLEKSLPQLPESVTYFEGADDLQKLVPNSPLNDAKLRTFRGYTNAQFQVSSSAEYNNLTLPKESMLEVFGLDRSKTPSVRLNLVCRYMVKALIFTNLDKQLVFPPRVPVLTSVSDHRYNIGLKQASVIYNTKERFFTKEEATNSNHNFFIHVFTIPADVIQVQPQIAMGAGSLGKRVVLICMFGSLLFFLVAIIKKPRKTT